MELTGASPKASKNGCILHTIGCLTVELLVKGCCGYYQQGGLQENKSSAEILHPAQGENGWGTLKGTGHLAVLYLLFLKHPLIASDRRSGFGLGGIEPALLF